MLLLVSEMMCNHCTSSVEKALRGVATVTDVSVDLDSKLLCRAVRDFEERGVLYSRVGRARGNQPCTWAELIRSRVIPASHML